MSHHVIMSQFRYGMAGPTVVILHYICLSLRCNVGPTGFWKRLSSHFSSIVFNSNKLVILLICEILFLKYILNL